MKNHSSSASRYNLRSREDAGAESGEHSAPLASRSVAKGNDSESEGNASKRAHQVTSMTPEPRDQPERRESNVEIPVPGGAEPVASSTPRYNLRSRDDVAEDSMDQSDLPHNYMLDRIRMAADSDESTSRRSRGNSLRTSPCRGTSSIPGRKSANPSSEVEVGKPTKQHGQRRRRAHRRATGRSESRPPSTPVTRAIAAAESSARAHVIVSPSDGSSRKSRSKTRAVSRMHEEPPRNQSPDDSSSFRLARGPSGMSLERPAVRRLRGKGDSGGGNEPPAVVRASPRRAFNRRTDNVVERLQSTRDGHAAYLPRSVDGNECNPVVSVEPDVFEAQAESHAEVNAEPATASTPSMQRHASVNSASVHKDALGEEPCRGMKRKGEELSSVDEAGVGTSELAGCGPGHPKRRRKRPLYVEGGFPTINPDIAQKASLSSPTGEPCGGQQEANDGGPGPEVIGRSDKSDSDALAEPPRRSDLRGLSAEHGVNDVLDLESLTVAQLRYQCRRMELATSGKKSDLLHRLQQAVALSSVDAQKSVEQFGGAVVRRPRQSNSESGRPEKEGTLTVKLRSDEGGSPCGGSVGAPGSYPRDPSAVDSLDPAKATTSDLEPPVVSPNIVGTIAGEPPRDADREGGKMVSSEVPCSTLDPANLSGRTDMPGPINPCMSGLAKVPFRAATEAHVGSSSRGAAVGMLEEAAPLASNLAKDLQSVEFGQSAKAPGGIFAVTNDQGTAKVEDDNHGPGESEVNDDMERETLDNGPGDSLPDTRASIHGTVEGTGLEKKLIPVSGTPTGGAREAFGGPRKPHADVLPFISPGDSVLNRRINEDQLQCNRLGVSSPVENSLHGIGSVAGATAALDAASSIVDEIVRSAIDEEGLPGGTARDHGNAIPSNPITLADRIDMRVDRSFFDGSEEVKGATICPTETLEAGSRSFLMNVDVKSARLPQVAHRTSGADMDGVAVEKRASHDSGSGSVLEADAGISVADSEAGIRSGSGAGLGAVPDTASDAGPGVGSGAGSNAGRRVEQGAVAFEACEGGSQDFGHYAARDSPVEMEASAPDHLVGEVANTEQTPGLKGAGDGLFSPDGVKPQSVSTKHAPSTAPESGPVLDRTQDLELDKMASEGDDADVASRRASEAQQTRRSSRVNMGRCEPDVSNETLSGGAACVLGPAEVRDVAELSEPVAALRATNYNGESGQVLAEIDQDSDGRDEFESKSDSVARERCVGRDVSGGEERVIFSPVVGMNPSAIDQSGDGFEDGAGSRDIDKSGIAIEPIRASHAFREAKAFDESGDATSDDDQNGSNSMLNVSVVDADTSVGKHGDRNRVHGIRAVGNRSCLEQGGLVADAALSSGLVGEPANPIEGEGTVDVIEERGSGRTGDAEGRSAPVGRGCREIDVVDVDEHIANPRGIVQHGLEVSGGELDMQVEGFSKAEIRGANPEGEAHKPAEIDHRRPDDVRDNVQHTERCAGVGVFKDPRLAIEGGRVRNDVGIVACKVDEEAEAKGNVEGDTPAGHDDTGRDDGQAVEFEDDGVVRTETGIAGEVGNYSEAKDLSSLGNNVDHVNEDSEHPEFGNIRGNREEVEGVGVTEVDETCQSREADDDSDNDGKAGTLDADVEMDLAELGDSSDPVQHGRTGGVDGSDHIGSEKSDPREEVEGVGLTEGDETCQSREAGDDGDRAGEVGTLNADAEMDLGGLDDSSDPGQRGKTGIDGSYRHCDSEKSDPQASGSSSHDGSSDDGDDQDDDELSSEPRFQSTPFPTGKLAAKQPRESVLYRAASIRPKSEASSDPDSSSSSSPEQSSEELGESYAGGEVVMVIDDGSPDRVEAVEDRDFQDPLGERFPAGDERANSACAEEVNAGEEADDEAGDVEEEDEPTVNENSDADGARKLRELNELVVETAGEMRVHQSDSDKQYVAGQSRKFSREDAEGSKDAHVAQSDPCSIPELHEPHVGRQRDLSIHSGRGPRELAAKSSASGGTNSVSAGGPGMTSTPGVVLRRGRDTDSAARGHGFLRGIPALSPNFSCPIQPANATHSAMQSQTSRPVVFPCPPPPSPAPVTSMRPPPVPGSQQPVAVELVRDMLPSVGARNEDQGRNVPDVGVVEKACAAAEVLARLVEEPEWNSHSRAPRGSREHDIGEGAPHAGDAATNVEVTETPDVRALPPADIETRGEVGRPAFLLPNVPTPSSTIAALRAGAGRNMYTNKSENRLASSKQAVVSRLERFEKTYSGANSSPVCAQGATANRHVGRARLWGEVEILTGQNETAEVVHVSAEGCWDVASLARQSSKRAESLAREVQSWKAGTKRSIRTGRRGSHSQPNTSHSSLPSTSIASLPLFGQTTLGSATGSRSPTDVGSSGKKRRRV